MIEIRLFTKVGAFAENKDLARKIRVEELVSEIKKGGEIILDFEGIESTTQSFIHALISELIREYGIKVIDQISFKNCNKTVRQVVNIVVDYMQA